MPDVNPLAQGDGWDSWSSTPLEARPKEHKWLYSAITRAGERVAVIHLPRTRR